MEITRSGKALYLEAEHHIILPLHWLGRIKFYNIIPVEGLAEGSLGCSNTKYYKVYGKRGPVLEEIRHIPMAEQTEIGFTKMTNSPAGADKKIAAGICGILLGGLGIHKFILGYTTEGAIMLAASIGGIVLSCLFIPMLATFAMGIIGLIEGIIYLTKTDEEFVATYITNKKGWF